MKFHKFLKRRLYSFFLLVLISSRLFTALAAGDERKEETKLKSLCPSGLSAYLNGNSSPDEIVFFQQWQSIVRGLAPILQEGGAPSLFISHAWHVNANGSLVDEKLTPDEARYYDQMDLQLANILKIAGFEVYYDKDMTNAEGIINEGAKPFMEKKVREADVVMSVCTPLYHTRSSRPSGVKIEVDRIKDRFITSPTVGFYIPLLVSYDQNMDPFNLLVGQDLDRIKQVLYLDFRNKSTFISNIWQVFHRLWNNLKLKWKEHPNFSHLSQSYISILENLLSIDDYYDDQNQPHPSSLKDGLRNKHNTLRIFTSPLKNIDPNDIANLIKRETQTHQDLFNASRNRDIVLFLGNTGAGKSTLINLLAGKDLKIDPHGQGYELIDLNDPKTLKIGKGADSETLYPQWIPVDIKGEDLLFFDLPGFNDTDGTIRNLVNSAFIYQIVKEASSIRFVFVAGQDEVTAGRGAYIKKLFHALQKAFTSPTVIENNSMFIMTKSMFKFQDREKAIDFLWDKMKSASGEAFQNQLNVWRENGRLLHIPHPQFDDQSTQHSIKKILSATYESLSHKLPRRFDQENRKLMLTNIQKIKPATHEEIQGFNISGFYSLEVNLPLQNMFWYLMEKQINKISTLHNHPNKILREQWSLFLQGKEGDLVPNKVMDLTVMEYDNEIKEYEPEEIQLLKEVCQDPYESAYQDFKDKCNQWNELEKYTHQLKTCQSILFQKINKHLVDEHEAVCRRFLGGALIYKRGEPDEVRLPILALDNPLEGTFDLSKCGDVGKSISIATGYRKGQKAENKDKTEVWIVPKFVVEKNLSTTAKHLAPIMDKFTSPLGIFWTDGAWDNSTKEMGWYDYLTVQGFDELSNGENLYEKYIHKARIAVGTDTHARPSDIPTIYLQF